MLTKKHMRPQVSSKLPLTMGKKKSHRKGEQQGGGSIPQHCSPTSQRGHVTGSSPPGGSAGPTCPAAPCRLGRIFQPWLSSEMGSADPGLWCY